MEGYASIMIGPAGDSNTQHFAKAALTSCVCLCVVIWPFGVPLLYAVGFWWNWPEISRLRRAELRHKSTKALSKARRQSVGHQRLLEGNLVVTFGALDAGDKEDENAEPADEELLPAAGRFEVALKHRRLELLATDGSPLLQLELLAGSHARLGDDEKQLLVEGTFTSATDDAGGRRVQLTLAPLGPDPSAERKHSVFGVPLPRSLTRSLTGLTSLTTSRPASLGPSLHAWQVAITKEVPDLELSLEGAEEQLRQMRLAPILMPYALRCFWCTHILLYRGALRES